MSHYWNCRGHVLDFSLKCKLTGQFFLNPVRTNDNCFYEKDAIIYYLKQYGTSPTTGEVIGDSLLESSELKAAVQQHLAKHPAEKSKQYVEQHYWNSDKFITLSSEEQITYLNKCSNLEYIDHEMKPIHVVCKHSTLPVLKCLIAKGVDLNSKASHGWTAVHFVCKYGTLDMLKCLVEHGVDLNSKNSRGWTPVHFVCKLNKLDILKCLICHGANLECGDVDGLKPIHIACMFDNLKVLSCLVDKGVNFECTDNHGWTPVQAICENGSLYSIQYILNKKPNCSVICTNYNEKHVAYSLCDILDRNVRLDEEEKSIAKSCLC